MQDNHLSLLKLVSNLTRPLVDEAGDPHFERKYIVTPLIEWKRALLKIDSRK